MARRHPHLAPALAAALLLLPATRVLADVAATGTFDIAVSGFPPTVTFNGSITFDPGERTTDVGDMSFDGDADVSLSSKSATFSLEALPEGEAEFEFTASGAGSCDNTACAGGSGTFAGRFTTITDPDNVLPDGIYTFDGTASTSGGSQGGPGGAFAINAFPRTPTPIGSNVSVTTGPQTFYDTVLDDEHDFVASALFANVSEAGDTQFVAFSALPGAFPTGVNLNPVAALFVDVTTNAMVSGPVRLCLSYVDADNNGIVDGTANLTVPRLRLLHAASIGAPFTDVTVFAGDLQVCGDAPAVGPIAIGALPPTATTTTTTTSTSSTLPPGATTTTSSTSPTVESTTTSTTVPSGESTSTSTTVPSGTSTTTSSIRPSTTSTTVRGSTTTSTTLPVCANALDCVEEAIAGPLCPGETVNQKLSTVILKKLTTAQTALIDSLATEVAKKKTKLVNKARKQLGKIGTKADAFVKKKKDPISVECRDKIRAAIALVTQQIEANRI
jgi:hypothetical protein